MFLRIQELADQTTCHIIYSELHVSYARDAVGNHGDPPTWVRPTWTKTHRANDLRRTNIDCPQPSKASVINPVQRIWRHRNEADKQVTIIRRHRNRHGLINKLPGRRNGQSHV